MKITKQKISIVIVGTFNPTIVTPDWLVLNNFITKSDFSERNIELINNEFSIFTIPDVHVFVSREKFQLSSDRYEFSELLFDLSKNVTGLLNHTPVTQFGINRLLSYSLNDSDERNSLGFKLVPKELWTEILTTYEGMTSLRVQNKRTDEYDGNQNITISPSNLDPSEVIFSLNDHFNISGGCKQIIKIISEKSNPDGYFEKICEHLLNSIRK